MVVSSDWRNGTLNQPCSQYVNFLTDTKVSNDTFVQLFDSSASGVIALCRRFHAKDA
jgi:hypothetical protein